MKKPNGILLRRNDIKFHLVKVIVRAKTEHFLTSNCRKVLLEFFSGTSGYNIDQKIVQKDRGYQLGIFYLPVAISRYTKMTILLCIY